MKEYFSWTINTLLLIKLFEMELPIIKCSELFENEHAGPYVRETFEVLENHPDTKPIIRYFDELYLKSGIQISGPGHSMRRYLAFEMGFYFQKARNRVERISHFPLVANGDAAVLTQCKANLALLIAQAKNFKYRLLRQEHLELLALPDFKDGLILQSDILNEAGIRAMIDTYLNFPVDLYQKLLFA